MIKDQIIKALQKATGNGKVQLEHPEDEKFGDFSTNIALQEKDKKNPREIAKEIVRRLKKDKELTEIISKIEVAGPGFINLSIKNDYFIKEAERVLRDKEKYGAGRLYQGKKVMVEYAHPNTHKEFHIGHLRNICLGESLARILKANGSKVIRTNYQGDIGLHVAKAVWGVERKLEASNRKLEEVAKLAPPEKARFLGQAYAQGAQAYGKDFSVEREIDQLNQKIYQQDPEIVELWKTTRQWSLDYFAWIYRRLGTNYDRLYLESEVAGPGTKNAQQLLKKGILEKSKGAVVFKGDQYGLDTRVFLTKENLPTYEAKELGLAPLEFSQFGEIDRCIHVVGPEQTSFFQVTFRVEELWEPEKYKGKQYHLRYGLVDLKEGKMSSREGRIVAGMDVVDQVKEKVLEIMFKSQIKEREKTAEKIAVGAVKYSLLKQGVGKNIQFDIEESVSINGDSGSYLQYTYARAKSVLRKFEIRSASWRTKYEINSSIINH